MKNGSCDSSKNKENNIIKGVIVGFVVSAIVVLIVYQKNKDRELMVADITKHDNGFGQSLEGCNFFSGIWVFDEKSYPPYKEKQCSFLTDEFACERFGSKDFMYQSWRWQPHHCWFYMKEYNATIDFYWSPYLVELNCDDAWDHHDIDNPMLRVNAIEKHGGDRLIAVMESIKEFEVPRHFEISLQTWSNWLKFHIDPNKTQLFFTSLSATHLW
ncbi:Trichome birefringence-like, N-terminal domain [Dillenia turbinata]|uniref:Trichome birefringence-like, N-terminal domain n=1 Tax=Dillenia turbinata TaxID=194707 RepID=A0AAN8W7Q8_9MAGN